MKWLVIGISGPTCSGKTSVAKSVHKSIADSVLINQDKYFRLQDDPNHILIPELNHFNWEILSSLDMSKLHSDILETIEAENTSVQENSTNSKIKLLIIEGNLLFNYKPIADLCDVKYFIEISREVCWSRRSIRVYDPPDVPGYFDKVVWPEYLRHLSEIKLNKDLFTNIKFVDGTRDLREICDEITNEVTKLMN